MKEMNRREVIGAMSAFAFLTTLADAQKAESGTPGDLTRSRVFSYDSLPVVHAQSGNESRAVVEGNLLTSEHVELHQTTLQPGLMPHPPHRHSNSEFILLRQGTVDYLTDGHVERVNVGDIIYTASNKPHGMRNVGTVPAQYYVVSVGVQDKATEVSLAPPA